MNFKQDELWIKKYYLAMINESTLDQFTSDSNPSDHPNIINTVSLVNTTPNPSLLNPRSASKKKEKEKKHIDNLFEQLISKQNLDILCLKAKSLSQKYNFLSCY